MSTYAGNPKQYDLSDFADSLTGECLCGSIKITLNKPGLLTEPNGHLCHCANCRKFSGCVAASNLVMNRQSVQIDDPNGFLKTYHDSNTGSGGTARRSFCSNCGSPVASIPTDSDEQYVVSLGIFPRMPQPAFELFAAHRHEWLPAISGAIQYRFMTSDGTLES